VGVRAGDTTKLTYCLPNSEQYTIDSLRFHPSILSNKPWVLGILLCASFANLNAADGKT